MLDELRAEPKPGRVLWLCASREQRNEIKKLAFTKLRAGLLLGYPECFVRFDIESTSQMEERFLNAVIATVGNDYREIERALRDNIGVDIPNLPDNVPRTEARVPFAIHIACDVCLASSDSPSAKLNEQNEGFALDVDVKFHAAIRRVAQLSAQLVTAEDSQSNEAFAEIESLHKSLFS